MGAIATTTAAGTTAAAATTAGATTTTAAAASVRRGVFLTFFFRFDVFRAGVERYRPRDRDYDRRSPPRDRRDYDRRDDRR